MAATPVAGRPAWAIAPDRLATVSGGPAAEPALQSVVREDVRLTASDGVGLAGEVYRPERPGAHPLLVVPGAWMSLATHEVTSARRLRALAAAGYVVVTYDPRGFRRSGGSVDMAGPKDVDDVSRVIDWALAHEGADPARIGLLSESYGAAVSLNAAAFDARVRAVAALSGWTDLVAAQWRNGTSVGTVKLFQELVGRLNGRFDERLTAVLADPGRGSPGSLAWARQRSPRTHVARLNRHKPAVLLVNEWDDALIPAGQTGEFLDALEGPKQLHMRPGGHGDSVNPTLGFLGGASLWERAVAWVDRYVAGTGDGPTGPAVVLRPRTPGPLEHYPGWAALRRADRRVPLTPVRLGDTAPLIAGLPSAAESGPFPAAGALDALGVHQPTVLPLLAPPAAAVWTSAPLSAPHALRGAPQVGGSLTADAEHGTLVIHLYDTDPLGQARLLTHAPYSFRNHPARRPLHFTVPLPATAWDLPAGHRIAVVLDTVDHRYASAGTTGSRLAIDTGAIRLTAPLTPLTGLPPR
ncbi:alpha/beta fold hydrolase [Streptomyces lavendofoliae]|uniref:alpha/beta fold hydrolase n=1 Tax=Streptomyces lavendofoliae TaxID=67314 RepID=UPI003D8A9D58